MKTLLIAVVAIFALSSCSSVSTKGRFTHVEVGMDEAEVQHWMGSPSETHNHDNGRKFLVWDGADGMEYGAAFDSSGKVAKTVRHLNEQKRQIAAENQARSNAAISAAFQSYGNSLQEQQAARQREQRMSGPCMTSPPNADYGCHPVCINGDWANVCH